MEGKVGATSHPSVDALKAKVKEEWTALTPAFIKKSCRSFRRRVEATDKDLQIMWLLEDNTIYHNPIYGQLRPLK